MLEEIKGIVVSEMDYKETSKILQVMTKEHGIIGVISKGCRSLKSDLRSVSSKLTYGTFHISFHEKGLSTLLSVDILNSFRHIKMDMERISYASFILELAEQVYKECKREEIFDLLIQTLNKIEEQYDAKVLMNILELKYLEYLGVMPILDACAICGSKKNIVTLSSRIGGYICRNCYTNEPIVEEKAMKLLRMFYYIDIAKITKLELEEKPRREVDHFLSNYYDSYTGLYLKSKKFIEKLNEVG